MREIGKKERGSGLEISILPVVTFNQNLIIQDHTAISHFD